MIRQKPWHFLKSYAAHLNNTCLSWQGMMFELPCPSVWQCGRFTGRIMKMCSQKQVRQSKLPRLIAIGLSLLKLHRNKYFLS